MRNIEVNKTPKSYKSVVYPPVPESIDDVYIITTVGDRLDLLAKKYYNDEKLWYIIANTNNLNVPSLVVEAGIQLRIPKNIETFLYEASKINK